MSKIKKINLLFCLIFSFIFLFGSVSPVSAAVTKERQTLKQCIDQKEYSNEIIECVVDYTTQNIRNNGNRKIIWSINNMNFRIAEHPWYTWDNLYRFGDACAKISENKDFALIHVTVYRKSGVLFKEKKFDLTFELKIN